MSEMYGVEKYMPESEAELCSSWTSEFADHNYTISREGFYKWLNRVKEDIWNEAIDLVLDDEHSLKGHWTLNDFPNPYENATPPPDRLK